MKVTGKIFFIYLLYLKKNDLRIVSTHAKVLNLENFIQWDENREKIKWKEKDKTLFGSWSKNYFKIKKFNKNKNNYLNRIIFFIVFEFKIWNLLCLGMNLKIQ